jgi:hypothetical protein
MMKDECRMMKGSKRGGVALPLETRKRLSVASMTLREPGSAAGAVPAVFVLRERRETENEVLSLKADEGIRAPKVETREQAELRRERVESITRRAPEVVITRRWIHTASHFDGQEAVVVKLPWMQRLRLWLAGD